MQMHAYAFLELWLLAGILAHRRNVTWYCTDPEDKSNVPIGTAV